VRSIEGGLKKYEVCKVWLDSPGSECGLVPGWCEHTYVHGSVKV